MIRNAIEEDVGAITELSREFWESSGFDEPFCPHSVGSMVEFCLSDGLLCVCEDDLGVFGFVAAVIGPLLGNHDYLTGTEMAWWINPDRRGKLAGVRLLKFVEIEAKKKGVKHWTMIVMESLEPEVGAGIYTRMGYNKTETSYTKVL